MELIYLFGIKLYGFAIYVASFFNPKAKLWIQGRKGVLRELKARIKSEEEWTWFHCSSLGEFEQIQPLILAYKKEFTSYKILLTFFSPSGYEIKKNWEGADYVTYMPLDSPTVSKKFLDIVNPKMVFFTKYDFWHYYIKNCRAKKIPFFSVSSIFRPYQIYFQWYGTFFKNILKRVTHFFVQNQSSLELMYRNSLPDVTVSGDTRFDRVFQNKENRKIIPEIEKWSQGSEIIILGSTWPSDIKLLSAYVKEKSHRYKFIIAPHEVNSNQLQLIEQQLTGLTIRYSQLHNNPSAQKSVLIIDNIGMLSSLYAYGKYAYVGGGFGQGIHNILEAAVFGIPIFIGPNYKKFQEANDLKSKGSLHVIHNGSEMFNQIGMYESNKDAYVLSSENNRLYIEQKKGATSIIMSYLHINYN
ncbi:MAG TPA: glycosyltransferase N-terminal domain-containing protein [Bacteroidia bacterium]|nr:glycosyltransferase N-terminal domain-containing protein [Bacteroidia bacterium]HNT80485.1 glycosyltransferase N-terminal domain-containing protein [Bacteroidia bacterium]